MDLRLTVLSISSLAITVLLKIAKDNKRVQIKEKQKELSDLETENEKLEYILKDMEK